MNGRCLRETHPYFILVDGEMDAPLCLQKMLYFWILDCKRNVIPTMPKMASLNVLNWVCPYALEEWTLVMICFKQAWLGLPALNFGKGTEYSSWEGRTHFELLQSCPVDGVEQLEARAIQSLVQRTRLQTLWPPHHHVKMLCGKTVKCSFLYCYVNTLLYKKKLWKLYLLNKIFDF